jgi:hypothetical protein
MSEPALEKPVLETAVPEHDCLLRLAASDPGRACKSLAAGEPGIRPGPVVLDLGCGPGRGPARAAARRPGGGGGLHVRKVTPVTAVMRDVAKAGRFLGFQRVTDRAVAGGYLTEESAGQWLRHLTTQPFFASVTLYILTAGAG